MPNLLVRGISLLKLRTISSSLVEELADICSCGTDNFTIDCLHTNSVYGGNEEESYPFVEVGWFDRGQAIRDRFAAAIASHLRQIEVEEAEVAFRVYREDSYYIDGKPCG
ncbi:DUF1904 family protein [Paenibacillus sp. GCM10023252]|uniref:DUF1904 family protein n=1 Tax=Paenibacillus sp. GCM10023252 TaxID=3252649 RepID=UPI0036065FB8